MDEGLKSIEDHIFPIPGDKGVNLLSLKTG